MLHPPTCCTPTISLLPSSSLFRAGLAHYTILICVVLGLALAVVFVGSGRLVRGIIASYVEFIRNVPLLLLIYLVFYGIPSIGGFAYDRQASFLITLSAYAVAHLVAVFRSGLAAVPKVLVDAGISMGHSLWPRLTYVRLPGMTRSDL